jgi:uncharacterized protein (TIRG00374 family)
MPSMRKLIILLAIFMIVGIVFISFGELEKTWLVLQHANPLFLIAAICVMLLNILSEALNYKFLYKLMGMEERLKHLALLTSTASFINVIAPSGGFGGIAIFVDDAGKRGNSRGLAAAAGALFLFLEYTAFLLVLSLGLVVLVRRNDLGPGEISASAIMLVIVLSLGFVIYLGAISGERLGRLLQKISHFLNRFIWFFTHKEYFSEISAHTFGLEVSEGLGILRVKKRSFMLPLSISLVSKLLQITIMALVFKAFNVDFSLGTVVAGFSSAYLFLIVSPTPYGIGIVETILPMAFYSLNIPWAESVISTLVYRGITFWVPLLLGGVSFRYLSKE